MILFYVPWGSRQDPTLNLLFDRAFEEHQQVRRSQGGDEVGELEDASQMIGIVSRLGGGKRALAVGLGSGGRAGMCVFLAAFDSVVVGCLLLGPF